MQEKPLSLATAAESTNSKLFMVENKRKPKWPSKEKAAGILVAEYLVGAAGFISSTIS